MQIVKYDKNNYDFRSIVSEWFGSNIDLSQLHKIKHYEHFERENDQSTIWHKTYYSKIRIDKSFDNIYVTPMEQIQFGLKLKRTREITFLLNLIMVNVSNGMLLI